MIFLTKIFFQPGILSKRTNYCFISTRPLNFSLRALIHNAAVCYDAIKSALRVQSGRSELKVSGGIEHIGKLSVVMERKASPLTLT